MIERKILPSIMENLNRRKVIQILGPRQSGKTTLLHKIKEQIGSSAVFYNCDEQDNIMLFSSQNSADLRSAVGKDKTILLDEAQRIDNVGLSLKIIHDTMPDIRIIATGSSAFELSDRLNEPLTGRKTEYQLLPFAFEELAESTSQFEEYKHRYQRLIYGSYPEVVNNPGLEVDVLTDLCTSYLYKDIFTVFNIRKPELVEKLLQALALQLTGEVSFNELAQLLSSDPVTIERYITMLERAFIIFRIMNYSNNQRNEIKKSRKIYFYDNGIRNALIADYRPIELRDDIGKLWENYIVAEFIKRKHIHRGYHKEYFWRSTTGSEIDYLELKNNQLTAYEIKWNAKKAGKFKGFLNHYPNAVLQTVNPENYCQYLSKAYNAFIKLPTSELD
jgi:predicted AAA+ superfamily ATPase